MENINKKKDEWLRRAAHSDINRPDDQIKDLNFSGINNDSDFDNEFEEENFAGGFDLGIDSSFLFDRVGD